MTSHFTLLSFIGLVIWNCDQSAVIESNEAMRYLNNDGYYFLDVRTFKEHQIKSIPNTDCIPVQEVEQRIEELDKYRKKKIIVYCRSGNRSGTATKILTENGFQAYNMIGGMNGWKGKVNYEK